MPNFFAGPMRMNLSLTQLDDLPVTTDDPIVELNAWQCQVISVGGHAMGMPELTFVNSGTSHVLHWSSAPVDPVRRATLWVALLMRGTIWVRIGFDLQQSADLAIKLQPLTSTLAAISSAPLAFRVVEADLRVRLCEVRSFALVADKGPREEALFTFQPDGSLALGYAEVLAPLRHADAVTLEVEPLEKPVPAQRVRLKLAARRC
jgi:hypothetical protein